MQFSGIMYFLLKMPAIETNLTLHVFDIHVVAWEFRTTFVEVHEAVPYLICFNILAFIWNLLQGGILA
jgi:hypothetical protein